jgi:P27 family predicted phage terminase small subunit
MPGDDAEAVVVRDIAAGLWRRNAPTLARSVGLVREQQETLVDYCVTYARIVQGERALSRDGVIVTTERGPVKNGWVTALNQYRSHFRSLTGELGLSPSSAARLSRPKDSDEEDPFD